jgi:excisionase family DNA binding protein
MNENDVITYDNLPEAVKQILQKVDYIMNHLLNENASAPKPIPVAPEKELLTVAEVSQILNISTGAIYNMTSTRQIPFFKNRGRLYFDRQEIDEWIRQGRRKTLKQLQAEAEMETRKK